MGSATATLAAAHALLPSGVFAKHGLTGAEIAKQLSWPAVRDNIAATNTPAAIDGAQLLTPMAYLMHTGKAMPNGQAVPMAR